MRCKEDKRAHCRREPETGWKREGSMQNHTFWRRQLAPQNKEKVRNEFIIITDEREQHGILIRITYLEQEFDDKNRIGFEILRKMIRTPSLIKRRQKAKILVRVIRIMTRLRSTKKGKAKFRSVTRPMQEIWSLIWERKSWFGSRNPKKWGEERWWVVLWGRCLIWLLLLIVSVSGLQKRFFSFPYFTTILANTPTVSCCKSNTNPPDNLGESNEMHQGAASIFEVVRVCGVVIWSGEAQRVNGVNLEKGQAQVAARIEWWVL